MEKADMMAGSHCKDLFSNNVLLFKSTSEGEVFLVIQYVIQVITAEM